MPDRPDLSKGLDSTTFQNYYYLKEELVDFCRQEGLQTTGKKADLSERVAHYLNTGEKLFKKASLKTLLDVRSVAKNNTNSDTENLTETTLIEHDFVCTEKHRAFFADNNGRSLDDAIKCWKYKKSIQGHNRYEKSDLSALI